MKEKRIGVALTGSFCTIPMIFPQISALVKAGALITPILSYHVAKLDTRFGSAQEIKERLYTITGKIPIETIDQAEPIGPQKLLDLMIVAPCTGNTLAKIANGITDTPVLMAVKSHLRNERPVLIAVASNDSLAGNAKNIGTLLARDHIYFVPFSQDGVGSKNRSMQAKFSLLLPAAREALGEHQLQPMILGAGECLND